MLIFLGLVIGILIGIVATVYFFYKNKNIQYVKDDEVMVNKAGLDDMISYIRQVNKERGLNEWNFGDEE